MRVGRISPHEEVVGVFGIPARNFPHALRVACDVPLKDHPKRQNITANLPLFLQDFQQPRREEFARPLMDITTASLTGLPLHPSVLTFHFDIQRFLGFEVVNGVVGNNAMVPCFVRVVDSRQHFRAKGDFGVDVPKFSWMGTYPKIRTVKFLYKYLVEVFLGNSALCAADILPNRPFPKFICSHDLRSVRLNLRATRKKGLNDIIPQKMSGVAGNIESAMRWAGMLEAAALNEPVRLPSLDVLRSKVQSEQVEGKAKTLAETKQIERWYSLLQNCTRGEAIAKIEKEYKSLATKREVGYNAMHAQREVFRKDGKDEEANQLAKKFWQEDVLGARRSGLYTLKYAIVDDLVDALIPKNQANDKHGGVNDAYALRTRQDLTSSVDTEEQKKVIAGIDKGAQWLADHLHPEAFKTLLAHSDFRDSDITPRFEIRSANNEYDRAYYLLNNGFPVISLRPDNTWDTVVHEYGHHFDAMSVYPGGANKDFISQRAQQETVSLRRLTGYNGYRESEEAHPDRFIDAYVGKEYSNFNTEVTSMGLQNVALNARNFYDRDREHFLYTIYQMRGGQ